MTFPEARELAKAGAAVRREAWPVTRTLIYTAGAGSVRAVAAINNAGVSPATLTVVKNSDFGQAEFAAQDWRRA
jgi:hypothetical protein